MEKSDVKKSFGSSVRAWRGRLGISQEELAERADLHRTYVSDVERGARNLSLESITRLARALDVSVPSLFSSGIQVAGGDEASTVHRDFVDILLVEDNPDDAELALRAFKQARFANRVKVVGDGEEALDYLFCRGKYAGGESSDRPQMILLDLNLPGMDGLEVLRCIKADKRTAKMHVVILTMSSDNYDITECRRLGADNYIVKPVDFRGLAEATPCLNLNWALVKPEEARPQRIRE